MRHLPYSYTSFLILSVISGFWVQISFEGQNYLIFKSSSICRKFPSSVQLPVWLSEYPVMHNFLPWKESPFTRYPAWQCLSVSLSTSPLGGHTPQSAPRMTSCPQGPWEVVINCRQCGKITGGQFLCVWHLTQLTQRWILTTNSPCQRIVFQKRVISNEELSSKCLVSSYECFPDISSINLLNISLNNLLK